ncbi:kynureninase [Salimicrobium jeotgali]|uniref:Kynureninase n=1 Tax=Salimicrobium jeotgali TaxID=1230341 RepID=K2GB31_9BACI|nr:kynureninase [Salimicrobium jeotgali]AKG04878.1 kynureninase [Salimicrobium jeotgali]EKE31542.1 kynureninase [Salimicrobium jeotgali]MBM7696360.1 kynureninase [Salimicrobium jeotgali]
MEEITFRDEFYLPEGKIYMDGNSLGLMSVRAEKVVKEIMESWKKYGIDGWTEGEDPWFTLSERLGNRMAPLVGAFPEEVTVTGSTTSNLHQLTATFYRPERGRTKILADALAFPTDIYALQSQLSLKGYDESHLVLAESTDGHTIDEDTIIQAMTGDISLVILPSVLYRSGQVLDMEKLTAAAHERGITIGFDLSHSIGALPHRLSEWGVDFAFWCNYKYVNAGPGSVGGLYINREHFSETPGLTGWFGSDKNSQFDMEHTYVKAADSGAYQLGTPHVLSAAPLLGSLEMFEEAGMEALRGRSLKLTGYLMEQIDSRLSSWDFVIANPREESRRGGHVYLEHPEAARITKALKAEGVIPDFRNPNGIRLAPTALYNTFEDCFQTVTKLKEIMEKEKYKAFKNERDIIA